jgi:hypothetical protein
MLARTALVAVTAAAAAFAQNDFNFDKLTSGRLGNSLDLQVSSAPGSQILLIVPSSNAGPTPLFLVDPLDARSLQVGTDLLGAMSVAITSPTGGANYSLALPNNPTLSGIELHWQSLILLLGSPFFGQISNDVVTLTGAQDTGVVAPAVLGSARAFATGLVDADNNAAASDVLVAGGGVGTLTAATGLATSELWDFRHMRVVPGPTMSTARALHLAVRLNDSRVLMIGGTDSNGVTLASCELYNPATNGFSATGSMDTPRVLHAACKLADGRVMVAGGTSTVQPDVLTAISSALSSVEIWDPATGVWTPANAIGGPRLAPALTLLSNNQVMVSGGVQYAPIFGIPNANSVNTVQRWNPSTGTWTSGANMPTARAGHHYNQVTLADGRVLMTGGINITSILTAATTTPTNAAEAYNPTTNTWQSFPMPTARVLHSATRLADGRVVVCGGAQGTLTTPTSIANVDVFTPASNSWSSAPALTGPRSSHVGHVLPDGTLVLFGGQGATTTLSSIETLRF